MLFKMQARGPFVFLTTLACLLVGMKHLATGENILTEDVEENDDIETKGEGSGDLYFDGKVDGIDPNLYFRANRSFLIRQRAILQAFRHYRCPSYAEHQDFYKLSQTYNPKDHLSDYKYPDLVNEFVTNLEAGKYLKRFQQYPSTPSDSDQLIKFAQIISSAFDSSADLFYKTMAYFYTRLNFSVMYWGVTFAVSATETKGYRMPPPYEVTPTFYVPKDIILQLNDLNELELRKSFLLPLFIRSRTGMGLPEEPMAYFREDAGINSFHFFWHTDFSYWFDPAIYGFQKFRKGELFMHMHHQVMNRYNAQRISLGFPNYEPIDLMGPLNPGYHSDIVTTDFQDFPTRAPGIHLRDLSSIKVSDLKLYETRILDGVRQGYLIATNGSTVSIRNELGNDVLGATFESSRNSINPNLYQSLHNTIHRLIAKVSDPMDELKLPGGVEFHPEISMSDPIFFATHLYVDNINKLQGSYFEPYSKSDLELPGVSITSLEVKSNCPSCRNLKANELQTYFHNVSWDITNAMRKCDVVSSVLQPKVYASVKQLDHKDFQYKLKIKSDVERKVVIRILMAPSEYFNGTTPDLEQLRWSFFEMDKAFVKLSAGDNLITRESRDSTLTVPRNPSWKSLNRKIEMALRLNMPLLVNKNTRDCGWPQHFLLPQGRTEGMKYKLFAMVSDFDKDFDVDFEKAKALQSLIMCNVVRGKTPDKRPMGFPFDRKMVSWENFLTKNMFLTDVTIKHIN